MKRLFASVLTAAMVLSTAVFADPSNEEYPIVTGTVEEAAEDGSNILISTQDGAFETFVANIGGGTVILSSNGGYLEDGIKKGDKVAVSHSFAMTMSLPPQSYAYAVTVLDENAHAPVYIKVKDVEEKDNKYIVSSCGGQYEFTIDGSTEIAPYLTKNIVKASDIRKGDNLLVFYDISTRSIPEKAVAKKVIVANVNADVTEVNGAEMLPLRQVAENLGGTVSWDEITNTASVELDGKVCEFTIGSSTIIVDGEENRVAVAPALYNDKTMINTNIFEEVFAMNISK